MNKAVLISIRPRWCELILKGEKTVEVRKTKPKLKTPFKCYIYQSKDNGCLIDIIKDGDKICNEIYHGKPIFVKAPSTVGTLFGKDQKVIGEFTCNLIAPIAYTTDGLADVIDCETSCMKPLEFLAYGKGDVLYGWHISNLIIYDKPKELSELRTICRHYDDGLCGDCEYYDYANNESYRYEECAVDGLKPITRPPQSWCYVEGGVEE